MVRCIINLPQIFFMPFNVFTPTTIWYLASARRTKHFWVYDEGEVEYYDEGEVEYTMKGK